MLDLHRLRLLRELKHRGTLAAVADAGVPLLERAGRRLRLTPAAERLVEHTEAILERLEQARADLDASAASIGGTVRVAAFHRGLPGGRVRARCPLPEHRPEQTHRNSTG